jgi:Recombination endonuclease VII
MKSTVTAKICSKCGKEKPVKEFYLKEGYKNNLSSWCRECTRYYNGEYNKKFPEKAKDNKLKKAYNITLDEKNKKLERQKGRCGLCGTPEPLYKGWCVDHDHETKTVRSILCTKCNAGLGCFNDDVMLLKKAIAYLRYWRGQLPQKPEKWGKAA